MLFNRFLSQPFSMTVCAAALSVALALPADASGPEAQGAADLPQYDRLLPLEGGSNFRDMGGYFTADGQQVRRGLLFRSGAMASLTEADQAYLEAFGFQRVIDLRSNEERDLYPNRWAEQQGIELSSHDYSMREIIGHLMNEKGELQGMEELYHHLHLQIKPQMSSFFDAAVSGQTPLVVNCSAGQDRTGLTSALLLIALGVPRDVVVQDYLQSTGYRRPHLERGDVDLAEAAKDNWFAELMLRYQREDGAAHAAEPLLTADGVPYLRFALDRIEQDYGSIERFLDVELGVDADGIRALRERYLVATFTSAE